MPEKISVEQSTYTGTLAMKYMVIPGINRTQHLYLNPAILGCTDIAVNSRDFLELNHSPAWKRKFCITVLTSSAIIGL